MKVIFEHYINRFSGTLYSLLFFGFLGLAVVGQNFNFSIPKNTKIRDVASFATNLDESGKLNVPEKKTSDLKTTFVSKVPETSSYSYVSSAPSSYASPSYGGGFGGGAAFAIYGATVVNNPQVDAGNGIMKYGSYPFYYAHSNRGFSTLKNIYEGQQIVVEGTTYTVARRVVYERSYLDGNASVRANIYNAADYVNYRKKQYKIALMTCGNGSNDSGEYRLILFLE